MIKSQPLKTVALCKEAGVDVSGFSRVRRFLLNEKIIKKTDDGYCLFDFNVRPSLWETVQKKCSDAGGPLLDLIAQKLVLGEQDQITGWYKTSFEDESIKGIIIPRGASELKSAASVTIPDEFSAFLLTKVLLEEGDRLLWKQSKFEVKAHEEIYNGNDLSYYIVKLVEMLGMG